MKEKVVSKGNIRKRKNIIIAISITILMVFSLCLSTYYALGEYVYSMAVASKMRDNAQKIADNLMQAYDLPDNNTSWVAEAETLSIATIECEDIKLVGIKYMTDSPSHIWVITMHGYRSSFMEMAGYAQEFHEKGYNVIIPSLRGHRYSQYKHLGLGHFDIPDILEWINYIIGIDSNAKIILHGRSMGGAAVMMVTGENLPSNVVCAIEDCGYSNVYDEFKHVVKNVLGYPFSGLIISAGDNAMKRKTGVSFKDMDCVKQLKKSTTPTLFIHGSEDSFVPFWMLDVVYNANDSIYKEKLVVEGAEHAMSSTVEHDLYFDTVYAFIDRFIS